MDTLARQNIVHPMHSWAGQMAGTAVTPTHPLIRTFQPISLAEMAEVVLLNRTDTKFVLATADLLAALADLSSAYRVLGVGGNRLNHYQTLYFDTPDFALYHRHHAGAAERYKVRARAYVESDLAFYWGQQRVMLPGLAVAEVKQDGFSAHSDFIRHIRARHAQPTSFSKYCLGAARLYPHLKQNNFKRQLLLIQKLLSGGYHAHTH